MTEETHKHIIYIHLLIYVPTHMYIHNIKRMCLYIVHPYHSSVLLLSCIVFVLVLDNLGNDLTNNPCVYSTRQKTSHARGLNGAASRLLLVLQQYIPVQTGNSHIVRLPMQATRGGTEIQLFCTSAYNYGHAFTF